MATQSGDGADKMTGHTSAQQALNARNCSSIHVLGAMSALLTKPNPVRQLLLSALWRLAPLLLTFVHGRCRLRLALETDECQSNSATYWTDEQTGQTQVVGVSACLCVGVRACGSACVSVGTGVSSSVRGNRKAVEAVESAAATAEAEVEADAIAAAAAAAAAAATVAVSIVQLLLVFVSVAVLVPVSMSAPVSAASAAATEKQPKEQKQQRQLQQHQN